VLGGANFQITTNDVQIADIKPSDIEKINGKDFVKVEFLGKKYFFEIREHNEFFYFLVVSQDEDEIFIERNDKVNNKDKDKNDESNLGILNAESGNDETKNNGNNWNLA